MNKICPAMGLFILEINKHHATLNAIERLFVYFLFSELLTY